MPPLFRPRASLLVPLIVTALAGCQDVTEPRPAGQLQLIQGDSDTWTVNSLADPGDGLCDDTECTLREAIESAASGGTIVFAEGLGGAIGLTSGVLLIRVTQALEVRVTGERRVV